MLLFDEAQFYNKSTFVTALPTTQINGIGCLISSLGSANNAASELANRRDAKGQLIFRHYVIQPGCVEVKVSDKRPGSGPAFDFRPNNGGSGAGNDSSGSGSGSGSRSALSHWINSRAIPADVLEKLQQQSEREERRRLHVACVTLPPHISLRNYLQLSVIMGDAFNQEIANIMELEEEGSMPVFPAHKLDEIANKKNLLRTEHLRTFVPQRFVIAVDPSGGGKGSEYVIMSFAYYNPPDTTLHRVDPVHQIMVVRVRTNNCLPPRRHRCRLPVLIVRIPPPPPSRKIILGLWLLCLFFFFVLSISLAKFFLAFPKEGN